MQETLQIVATETSAHEPEFLRNQIILLEKQQLCESLLDATPCNRSFHVKKRTLGKFVTLTYESSTEIKPMVVSASIFDWITKMREKMGLSPLLMVTASKRPPKDKCASQKAMCHHCKTVLKTAEPVAKCNYSSHTHGKAVHSQIKVKGVTLYNGAHFFGAIFRKTKTIKNSGCE